MSHQGKRIEKGGPNQVRGIGPPLGPCRSICSSSSTLILQVDDRRRLELRHITMDLLIVLVERRGQFVSRSQILDGVSVQGRAR